MSSRAPVPPGTTVEELVRRHLLTALGGRRGVLEAAVPTAAFTVLWVAAHELRLALAVSAGLAGVLVLVRVAQRQNPQFVLNSLVGIGIAAVFALRSGRAQDAFLPGILLNAGYGAVLLLTIVTRWPLFGLLIGSVTGDPVAWRRDPAVVRVCMRLTAVLTAMYVVRVAVMYPLYEAGQVGWLGTAKIVLGWPLYALTFAALGWLLARGETPLTDPTHDPLSVEPVESGEPAPAVAPAADAVEDDDPSAVDRPSS